MNTPHIRRLAVYRNCKGRDNLIEFLDASRTVARVWGHGARSRPRWFKYRIAPEPGSWHAASDTELSRFRFKLQPGQVLG